MTSQFPPNLPPAFNPNASEHRRQIRDYLRYVGDAATTGLKLRDQAIVQLGDTFEPTVPLDWTQILGWNVVSDDAGLWDVGNQQWDFTKLNGLGIDFAIRTVLSAHMENNGVSAAGAGIGVGINGADPDSNAVDVSVILQLPRRQDFPFSTIQCSSPFIDPASITTAAAWVWQEVGDIDVLGTTSPAVPPSGPSNATWFSIEVWV